MRAREAGITIDEEGDKGGTTRTLLFSSAPVSNEENPWAVTVLMVLPVKVSEKLSGRGLPYHAGRWIGYWGKLEDPSGVYVRRREYISFCVSLLSRCVSPAVRNQPSS